MAFISGDVCQQDTPAGTRWDKSILLFIKQNLKRWISLQFWFCAVYAIFRCCLEKSRKTPIAPKWESNARPASTLRRKSSGKAKHILAIGVSSVARSRAADETFDLTNVQLVFWTQIVEMAYSKIVEMCFHSAFSLQHCSKFCRCYVRISNAHAWWTRLIETMKARKVFAQMLNNILVFKETVVLYQ